MQSLVTNVVHIVAAGGKPPSGEVVGAILRMVSPAPARPAPNSDMPLDFRIAVSPPTGMDENLNWRQTFWGTQRFSDKIRADVLPDALRLSFGTIVDAADGWLNELSRKIVDLANPGDLQIFAVAYSEPAQYAWFARHMGGGDFGVLEGWADAKFPKSSGKMMMAKGLASRLRPEDSIMGTKPEPRAVLDLADIYESVLA